MEFIKIDFENYNRKKHFNHYFNNIPCTFSLCKELDITHFLNSIKNRNLKFYPSIIFSLSVITNKHTEFRISIKDNELGYFDYVNPSYTIFNKEKETFFELWTEYNEDFNIFYENYKKDMEDYKNFEGFFTKDFIDNVFNISSIPWTEFSGFNLNLKKGYEYLLPIFTIGKYYEKDNKIVLPISVQVNHAVCDGYHVARFLNELQEFINKF